MFKCRYHHPSYCTKLGHKDARSSSCYAHGMNAVERWKFLAAIISEIVSKKSEEMKEYGTWTVVCIFFCKWLFHFFNLVRELLIAFPSNAFPSTFPNHKPLFETLFFFLEDRNYQTLAFFMAMNIFVPEFWMSAFFSCIPLCYLVSIYWCDMLLTRAIWLFYYLCVPSLSRRHCSFSKLRSSFPTKCQIAVVTQIF